MKKKALFLDRDGTINKDTGYINKVKNLRVLPGVYSALKKFKSSKFYIIIVSNQSGIARGLIKPAQLKKINQELIKRFMRNGIKIDGIYFCPHYKKGIISPWNKSCLCRKPSIGMFKRASRDFNIDLSESFVIGDKLTDILAGNRCGCKTILVLTGEGKKEAKNITRASSPAFIAKNLDSAISWINNYGKKY